MFRFSGAALRQLRGLAGLSQDKLAARSGIAHDTIVKLETGRRTDPRSSTLAILAAALGCRIDDLFRAAS
jgi:transcriptional regulator with XRE-family HTH domain